MRQSSSSIGQPLTSGEGQMNKKGDLNDEFVLEKLIFSNVFKKDIRRIFIYKKAERLARAVQLIRPAFADASALGEKIDRVALSLIDAALEPPATLQTGLSRELLTLTSVLAVARTTRLLSSMNADLIQREAQQLLEEVAGYEEPRILLEDAPRLSELSRTMPREMPHREAIGPRVEPKAAPAETSKGHLKDRQEAILAVIKNKGQAGIKDIAHLIRGVSEKTIQRELSTLIAQGVLKKQGERRWSIYSLAGS